MRVTKVHKGTAYLLSNENLKKADRVFKILEGKFVDGIFEPGGIDFGKDTWELDHSKRTVDDKGSVFTPYKRVNRARGFPDNPEIVMTSTDYNWTSNIRTSISTGHISQYFKIIKEHRTDDTR